LTKKAIVPLKARPAKNSLRLPSPRPRRKQRRWLTLWVRVPNSSWMRSIESLRNSAVG
jgi:hypothetical protein